MKSLTKHCLLYIMDIMRHSSVYKALRPVPKPNNGSCSILNKWIIAVKMYLSGQYLSTGDNSQYGTLKTWGVGGHIAPARHIIRAPSRTFDPFFKGERLVANDLPAMVKPEIYKTFVAIERSLENFFRIFYMSNQPVTTLLALSTNLQQHCSNAFYSGA